MYLKNQQTNYFEKVSKIPQDSDNMLQLRRTDLKSEDISGEGEGRCKQRGHL